MKKVSKSFTKIDFKNARFEVIDNLLMVVEYDKDNECVIEENIFMEVIKDLIGEENLTISIKREQDLDE